MSILDQDRIIKIIFVKGISQGLADEGPQHQGRNDRKLVRHFEHDQEGGHWRSDDGPETTAHAHDRQHDAVRRGKGKPGVENTRDHDAGHAAEKQQWRKNTAAASPAVRANRGNQLGKQQSPGNLPWNQIVQSIG